MFKNMDRISVAFTFALLVAIPALAQGPELDNDHGFAD
jgi:hypothetical protein